jgi:hypothetical protein
VKCPATNPVNIFCYQGQKTHLLKMFQSAFVRTQKYATKSGLFTHEFYSQVEIRGPATASWSVYLGSTAAEVEKSYEGHQSVFSWLTTQSQGPREVQLTPFNSSCLGVAVTKREGVEARLTLLHVSYYRLGACLAGKIKTSCCNMNLKYNIFSLSQACSCFSWPLDWPAAKFAITSQVSALVFWRLL